MVCKSGFGWKSTSAVCIAVGVGTASTCSTPTSSGAAVAEDAS
ncbi:hypothetical protein ABFP37_06255 [Burkholderia sp. RS01]